MTTVGLAGFGTVGQELARRTALQMEFDWTP